MYMLTINNGPDTVLATVTWTIETDTKTVVLVQPTTFGTAKIPVQRDGDRLERD